MRGEGLGVAHLLEGDAARDGLVDTAARLRVAAVCARDDHEVVPEIGPAQGEGWGKGRARAGVRAGRGLGLGLGLELGLGLRLELGLGLGLELGLGLGLVIGSVVKVRLRG